MVEVEARLLLEVRWGKPCGGWQIDSWFTLASGIWNTHEVHDVMLLLRLLVQLVCSERILV